jgi:hypothetical protein
VPHPGDLRAYLVPRKLAPLAGLGPLGHLDLELVGVDQVFRGDPEPSRGDLLDPGAQAVSVGKRDVAGGVFSSLSAVAAAAEAVHRQRDRLVHLLADRPVGHRRRGEPPGDLLHRFDLVDRDRIPCSEPEETAQRRAFPGLVVDQPRVFPEHPVVVRAHRLLELVDRLRIPQVLLPADPHLVEPAGVQQPVFVRVLPVRLAMPCQGLGGDLAEPDPPEPGGRAAEILVHELSPEADGLEDLRPDVASQRRDPHLAHRLEQPLLDGRDVGVDGIGREERFFQQLLFGQLAHRGKCDVGADPVGAVAEKERVVHDLPGLPRFDDDRGLRAKTPSDQVVMKARDGEQGRDRGAIRAHVPVGQDQEGRPLPDIFFGQHEDGGQGRGKGFPVAARGKQDVDVARDDLRVGGVAQPRHVLRREDGVGELEHPAMPRRLVQKVLLPPDEAPERHHQLLPERVDRGVGDLREQLLEIGEEQLRAVGQNRQGGVVPHGAHGLLPLRGHR